MKWLIDQLVNFAIGVFAGLSNVIVGVIVFIAAGLLWSVNWHRRQRKQGKPAVEPSYLIWGGAIGVIVCATATLGGLLRQHYGGLSAVMVESPQQTTFTPGIGTPPLPHRETVQWNEIFGTSRAIDLMFALFLDGTGPDDRSIKLQDAFIESASHRDVIHMQVVGTDNPLEEPFPITEANPVPPNGFIRLIAQMNARAPREGVSNKEFLERWRNIWFTVVYENGKKDRIPFDTSGYFPGLAGPHVTRRIDIKKN